MRIFLFHGGTDIFNLKFSGQTVASNSLRYDALGKVSFGYNVNIMMCSLIFLGLIEKKYFSIYWAAIIFP